MIKEIVNKLHLEPYKYEYINKACIIYTAGGNYVIKKDTNNSKIYDYLNSRNFSYYLSPKYNYSNRYSEYEVYDYIDEINIDKNLKAKDLILIVSELHNRTTSFKKIDLDKIKEIYEEKTDYINYLKQYYNSLEEAFNLHIYNSPSEYLLLRNLDKIYNTLDYSKKLLDDWYDKVRQSPNIRYTFNHNNLSLDHFVDGKEKYLINFNYAKESFPIYDIAKLYKNNYKDMDLETIYDIYTHKYPYNEVEELLLFIEIIIPEKIVFGKNNYDNVVKVYNLNKYLDSTRSFILKQQEKNKKRYNKNENQK